MLRFIPSSVLTGVEHLHDHSIVHRDTQHDVTSIYHSLSDRGEIFSPNAWLLNRPENVLFRTEASSDIVIGDFGMCVA